MADHVHAPTNPEQNLSSRFSTAYSILICLIVLVAALTWILSTGQGEYSMNKEVGRASAVAGTDSDTAPGSLDQHVISLGSGGSVLRQPDGSLIGVKAVIYRTAPSAVVARDPETDALARPTGAGGVSGDFATTPQACIASLVPGAAFKPDPPAGATARGMIACGGLAGIGWLEQASEVPTGRAGTSVSADTQKEQGATP